MLTEIIISFCQGYIHTYVATYVHSYNLAQSTGLVYWTGMCYNQFMYALLKVATSSSAAFYVQNN